MGEFGLREQLNDVQQLLDQAEEQGYLTADQILDAFPAGEDGAAALTAQLEDLFVILYDQGIEVCDNEEQARDGSFQLEEELGSGGDEHYGAAPDLSGIPVADAVGLYFRETSHVPLLAHEEEVALAKRLERGRKACRQLARNGHDPQERLRLKRLIQQGEEARQHLIEANTRLVVSVAKRYRGHGLPFLDLIQAGNLGLIKAADGFDYRRGTKFATYATWWIRQAITRSLSQHGRTIRFPVHMGDRVRKLYKMAQRMERDRGRWPTPEEIAQEAGLEPGKVRWLLQVWRQPLSLERPVGGEEGANEFGSFIEDESAPPPDQSAERHLLRKDLEEMLTTLTPREAYVLRTRFGLRGDRAYTLQEIGEKLGVTRERARQIEVKALRKLRHPRYVRKLRGYLD